MTDVVVQALSKIAEATSQPEGRVAVFITSPSGEALIEEAQARGLAATIRDWTAAKPTREIQRRFGIIDGTDFLTAQVIAAWHLSRGH